MPALDTLHQPQRLAGETQDAYRARRSWSKLLGQQWRVVTALPMQHRTDAVRRARRERVREIGIRQFKKLQREARA